MALSSAAEIRFLFDELVPMRDGINLSADVYLPAAEGLYPAIVTRKPYDNTNDARTGAFYAHNGYVFVAQDVRGRGDSEGQFRAFHQEAKDGYDTIEWVARQPWCNGKVGMTGASYPGMVQWMAARERPPHLVALLTTASAGRWLHGSPYHNGKFSPYFVWYTNLIAGRTLQVNVLAPPGESVVNWNRLAWYRPLKDLPVALGRTRSLFNEWLAHPTLDDYWRGVLLDDHFGEIDVPALHVTGWFDSEGWSEFFHFNQMMAHSPASDKQYLIVGPWSHHGTSVPAASLGGVNFSKAAVLDMPAIHLRWFDYWLKGVQNGQDSEPRVRAFVMGRNQWRMGHSWPPPNSRIAPYYFHGGGRANTLAGDGTLSDEPPAEEPPDRYAYNPEDPTPSQADLSTWPLSELGLGERPLDDRYVEKRGDVLVYTSASMQRELEVTGHPYAVLYAASDALDTDFMAQLTDVYPDGRSVPVAWGIMRASYRESLEKPTLLVPGQVYQYRIELSATSNAFLPGHRIRVDIMSGRFPRFDRNPNTGAPVGEDAEMRIATQTLYHDRTNASHVLLPVVPTGA